MESKKSIEQNLLTNADISAHLLLGNIHQHDIDSQVGGLDEDALASDIRQARIRALDWQNKLLSMPDKSSLTADQWVIALYGTDVVDDPHILDNCEHLEDSLRGKTGEPVMVMKQWLGKTKSPLDLQTFLYLGIISDDKLHINYKAKTIGLPVSEFCNVKNPGSDTKYGFTTHKSNIVVANLNTSPTIPSQNIGTDLHRPLDTVLMSGNQGTVPTYVKYPALEIVCGLDEIHQWFGIGEGGMESRLTQIDIKNYDGQYLTLKAMAKHLGIDGIVPVNPHLQRLESTFLS